MFRFELLKDWRERERISQEEAAAKFGISQSYFSRLEKGLRTPPTSMLVHISKVTEIPIQGFFGPDPLPAPAGTTQ